MAVFGFVLSCRLRKNVTAFVCLLLLLASSATSPAQKKTEKNRLPPKIEAALKVIHESEEHGLNEPGLRVEEFDLNGDGRLEYFAEDFCSPTGNCGFWILEERKGSAHELLATDLVQVVCVRYTKSNGYRDIQLSSHGSAFDSEVRVFRFDGRKYEESERFDVRHEYDDKTGKWRQVEEPTKREKCYELFRRRKPPLQVLETKVPRVSQLAFSVMEAVGQ